MSLGAPPPLKTFAPADLRKLNFTYDRTPYHHTITPQQLSTLDARISTQLDAAQLTVRPTLFLLARPPPKVHRSVWVCFVKPFTLDGTWFETLFLLGDTISTATFPTICHSTDASLSYHINWPLQLPLQPQHKKTTRRHLQLAIHRLLAFTFHFDPQQRGAAYNPKFHADHINKVHQHNYVHNLRILDKEIDDRSRKRRRLP